MTLFAELKRRKVIRVAGLYLVTAWLLVQVAETLLPMFGAPEWVARSLVILLALAFVPALVFTWVFERTADGLRRDDGSDADPAARAAGNRRLDIATLVVAGLAIGLLVYDRMTPADPQRGAALAGAATAAGAPSGNDADGAAAGNGTANAGQEGTAGAPFPAGVSIAVLPFADLSPEGDQAWFADGISEEILNVLVKVDGLTVASRTSSFQFRSQQAVGIPAIADALKVRHVLEGSVRKAGDRIRITAQLIDAQSDKHLWSETFDRQLDTENLFDIQDEIARAIVAAIDGNLGVKVGAVSAVPQRTDNVDAYQLYLRARTLYFARVDFEQIAELLRQAAELDPAFSDALAMRAAVFTIAPEYGIPLVESTRRSREITRELATQALALVPEHGLALGAISLSQDLDLTDGIGDSDFTAILAGYDRARSADPDNVDLLNWYGYGLMRAGLAERAADEFRRCKGLEPTYAPCRANLAGALLLQGKRDDAAAEIAQAASTGAIGPDVPVLLTLHELGHRESFYFLGVALAGLRGWHDFAELHDALARPQDDHTLLRARLEALSPGEPNEQVQALLIALGDHRRRVNNWVLWLPVYREYRGSATFKSQVVDSGILAYWKQEGFPRGCKAVGAEDFACD